MREWDVSQDWLYRRLNSRNDSRNQDRRLQRPRLPVIWEGAMANDWKMVLAGLGMLLVGIFASDAKK